MSAKFLTNHRKAVLRPKETPISRKYLHVLENWIPVGLEYFNDWPDRPNSGHFLGGCHWYGIETLSGALAFAAAASSPEYNAKRGGASRKELREKALKGLRYLCFTHDSGPEDCVRPQQGLGRVENCGTKWGERGKGFFRESQCGTTVSGMGVVALLLGDLVDAETWTMLAKVHLDYAERFGTMAPKSGVYTNTQMEENGWTSCGLASVELFLSKSNKASTWAETARRWMFSTATTQQDTKNLALLDGTHTVRQLTGEIFTALPDYMAENHGMVHPGYTASSLGFTGTLGVIYGLFGQEVPPHALFNRENVYRELKFTTDSTGSMHPMQGMDWPYLFTDPGTTTHAAASLLLKDPDAAAMEYRALETLAARQNSNGGRMYDADVAAKAHDVQDPMAIRECVIAGPAYTYLLHRVLGNGPKPTPERELEKKLRGVKVFPHSGFVFHRHRTGQASFSWRNNIMALPFNKDGIQTVAPASNTFLAKFSIRNRPESHDLVSIQVDEHAEGFAAALRMDRAQASVRQNVLFAGLPSGISLSYEQLTAQETLTVEHLEQGFLRIINEKFSALKSNCNGYRNFFTPDNQERFAGFIDTDPESDIVRDYNHPAWVNVDNRLGIIFNGPGKTVYHNRHYFNPWWAIADDLTLSRMEQKFSVKSGGEIASFTALLAPDQSHKKTSEFAFTVAKTKKDTAALIADGHLAAASFSDRVQNVDATVPRSDLAEIPVFAGTTAISDRTVSYSIRLEAGAAMLRKALLTVTAKGTLELVASETGQILATNKGRKAASITIAGKVQTIKPGTTLSL